MYDGFVERAEAVSRTLEDRRTTFAVVSTLETAPVREADYFIRALDEKGFHLGAVVLNKVLPSYFLDPDATASAQRLDTDALAVAESLPPTIGATKQVGRVLHEVGASFLNYRVVATREAEQQKELAHVPDVVATVPFFDTDIYDLRGLLMLGERFWR
jgi:anion-transporting  ArsA/GET3 family ATPase